MQRWVLIIFVDSHLYICSIQLNITADLLPPPFTDESYYCVFGELGSSVVEGNLIPGVNFTELTCIYNFTIDQFSDGIVGMQY